MKMKKEKSTFSKISRIVIWLMLIITVVSVVISSLVAIM
ncbi:DUF4044 domain-containing protein [Enterococcus hirae]|nr:DUF4044 domain-containing protein [Enterococcaceae bacterium]MCI1919121.1 DUF4044 domain-containing protein [Enterococcaceae bacterium]MDM8213531.1 DUF4044 domain-containing protein [Enterococcus hirae]